MSHNPPDPYSSNSHHHSSYSYPSGDYPPGPQQFNQHYFQGLQQYGRRTSHAFQDYTLPQQFHVNGPSVFPSPFDFPGSDPYYAQHIPQPSNQVGFDDGYTSYTGSQFPSNPTAEQSDQNATSLSSPEDTSAVPEAEHQGPSQNSQPFLAPAPHSILQDSRRALAPANLSFGPTPLQTHHIGFGSGHMASPMELQQPTNVNTPSQPLSKEWIVPPKPKPGRKPAVDTPPTKRKAQNRAAQRAFRERRAARVSELEQEARRKEQEYEDKHDEIAAQHTKELDSLKKLLQEAEQRSERVEKQNAELRRAIEELKRKDEALRHSSYDFNVLSRLSQSSGSLSTGYRSGQSSIDITSPTSSRRIPSLPDPTLTTFNSRTSIPTSPALCKDCGITGVHCGCIERRLSNLPLPNQSTNNSDAKSTSGVKREMNDEMEVDFTAAFSRPSTNTAQNPIDLDRESPSMASPSRPGDYCGFCTDDTNCVCKATMGDDVMGGIDLAVERGISEHSNQTTKTARPQPMEPSSAPSGPGTCADCLNNPAKADFCRKLASMGPPPRPARTDSVTKPVSPRDNSMPRDVDIPSDEASISCSETYDQLMQDQRFAQNEDRESFIRQLRPRQNSDDRMRSPSSGPSVPSAYEVEMASVLTAMNKTQSRENPDRPGLSSASSSS